MNREAKLLKRVILIFVFTFTLVVLIGVGALFAQKKLAGGSGKDAKDAAEALRMAETAEEEGGDAGRETADGSDAVGGSAGIPGTRLHKTADIRFVVSFLLYLLCCSALLCICSGMPVLSIASSAVIMLLFRCSRCFSSRGDHFSPSDYSLPAPQAFP